MNNNDYEKFYAMWATLLKMYGKNNDDLACKLSFKLLKSYDYADVKEAVFHYATHPAWGKHFPTPASIISIIQNTNKNSKDSFVKIEPIKKTFAPGKGYAKFKEDLALEGIILSDKNNGTECEIQNDKS